MKRTPTKRPRGAVKKDKARLLGAYLPDELVNLIDQAVNRLDTDRSKFFRAAIREKLARHNISPAA